MAMICALLKITALLALRTSSAEVGQQGVPDPGVNREQMWYAPTAEDWAKPCLLAWQRSWDDALAISQETKRPILICVNMDGEIASEHYAGVRYRQPEIAALYEPYVCVIASVYRHTPRDFDEEGRRIPCPRFGIVTCGEHIAIEPVLYEQFFEGQRISPRHIMIELDGSESYDVFYYWDTDSVFQTIRDGMEKRAEQPPPRPGGDRPLLDRVASRDRADRDKVEAAYQSGSPEERRALIEAARDHAESAPLDLIRLAVYDLDLDLNRLALQALARSTSPAAVDLIAEALRAPMAAADREALLAALDRFGATIPRAKTLAMVHRGLDGSSSVVNPAEWDEALARAGAPEAARDRYEVMAELDRGEAAAGAAPADPVSALAYAEAALSFALASGSETPGGGARAGATGLSAAERARLKFEDAHRAGLDAEAIGASGWQLDAVLAISAHYLGRTDEAAARAEAAVKALPVGEPSWNAMAVLGIFTEGRRAAIAEAMRAKREWPQQWLADVNAAQAVMARHPHCTAGHLLAQYDFLANLGAIGQASKLLNDGLTRFPDSWDLHDRYRGRLLADRGIAALERAYEKRLQAPDAPLNLPWYAGVASFVTAEYQRRAGLPPEADAAYQRAAAHLARSIVANPSNQDPASHYLCLSSAGRARLALERGDLDAATSLLISAFEHRPASAATLDGLNLSPSDTSRTLRVRLMEVKRADLLSQLEAALAKVDPALLGLPAYETPQPAQ
jgi:tetratricopeptide (TPR) repeat protein